MSWRQIGTRPSAATMLTFNDQCSLCCNIQTALQPLIHWSRLMWICVGNLPIIGSDNGLSPTRCQAIIWTNSRILLIWFLGTNFSEILIKIHKLSFTKMHLKMSSAKWRPFCLGPNVLNIDWKRLEGRQAAVVNDNLTIITNDDVIKWKHFPRFWTTERGTHRWIPRTKASYAELWCFLWSATE